MKRNPSRLWLVPAAIIIIFLGAYFFISSQIPTLTAWAPADADSLNLSTAAINLTFSRPMNKASVENAIRLQPNLPGELNWQENTLTFTPQTPWPLSSTVNVFMDDGMQSELGLALQDYPSTFSFKIENRMILYLSPASDTADIYIADPQTGHQSQLTDHQAVLDFNPHPDGIRIYYTVGNSISGSDIYLYDRAAEASQIVLDCGEARCSQAAAAPGGNYLAYVYQSAGGLPEVWLYDLELEKNERISPEGFHSHSPLWSDQGLLSYYNLSKQVYEIWDLTDETKQTAENQTGEDGTWAGSAFVAPELIELENLPYEPAPGLDNYFSSHLISFDSDRGTYKDLTREPAVEDTSPAASSDGSWIAFTRKYQDPYAWQLGRQLWLMRANGTNPHALTDMPAYRITQISWNPDGTQLAFVRFNQTVIFDPAEIWLIGVDGKNSFRLVIDAYSPIWLP